VLTDAQGTPLVVQTTAANNHDVNTLLPAVVELPKVTGKLGRPKWKPERLYADKGFDDQALRDILNWYGIEPHIPKRGKQHQDTNETGLGQIRWLVERTISWLHQFRRLKTRWERTTRIHQVFVDLANTIICFRQLIRLL
jgi:transposase